MSGEQRRHVSVVGEQLLCDGVEAVEPGRFVGRVVPGGVIEVVGVVTAFTVPPLAERVDRLQLPGLAGLAAQDQTAAENPTAEGRVDSCPHVFGVVALGAAANAREAQDTSVSEGDAVPVWEGFVDVVSEMSHLFECGEEWAAEHLCELCASAEHAGQLCGALAGVAGTDRHAMFPCLGVDEGTQAQVA
ncbi:hypothetical protein [Amycolatopsis alba]|uniref:hypothetical protein n=1 Tax=Amycolatopsis alba TaxID=76020 RepID=UPI001178C7A6|nr:hypothetical protein [Amycolatopsis alba]